MPGGKGAELFAMAGEKRMRGDDERPQLDQAGEDLIEVTFVTGVDDLEFEAVVPENSIRRDSRREAESAHYPMRCSRSFTCLQPSYVISARFC